jgi:hypothetical protein
LKVVAEVVAAEVVEAEDRPVQQPVLVHPERGPQLLVDVVRSNAHDAFHHQWDIQRALDGAQAPDGNQRSHQRSQRS